MNLYEEYPSELYHYGVKGMRWGKRKAKYESSSQTKGGGSSNKDNEREIKRKSNMKKTLTIGAAAAGTALAAYGAYKLSKVAKEKAFIKNYDRATKAVEKLLNDKKSSHIELKSGLYNKKDKWVQDTLMEDAYRYAKRHSSSTKSAVKTLLGKNRVFTVAELMNMGIDVSMPDFGWHDVNPKRLR